ncbi:twin-arginine translocation signal domain-containing protein [Pseudomonas sp. KU43P]|uniref:twin-arginine translocation signal domain-containing protein n=1 Tax=Pseudomonas sp. KU43P TaxID=2487887 RepID=UPI0012AAB560|nr:twin-arginine translocation signal domain-containing protein [Pseudomonas sp. KU43P]BBH45954.1 hypothetical protein KU43P_24310 [Pseudomonas sp. KU43P]
MGKLKYCSALLDRRGFLRNCVLLGVGGAALSIAPGLVRAADAQKPAEPNGFVVINGWVLPSQYFRND